MVAWRSRQRGLEQGDMIPPNGGHGAVQYQSAGNDGGEPGGTRTRDPMIKSHVLYRLSYGLGPRVCTGGLVRGQ